MVWLERLPVNPAGKLFLVSVGPGFADLIPPRARSAIEQSEVVVSYPLYLRWIKPWLADKTVISTGMREERERAIQAIQSAREGKTVSLLSSGDIGVYAMAGAVFELLEPDESFALEVIPGISAVNAAAALLGSPLSLDFATLSLSDLLCPWAWIEQRAQALAAAGLVVALYNVQSQERREGVYAIVRLFLEHRADATWCGVVRAAYREEQKVSICSLRDLLDMEFDMLTTIIIGNAHTARWRDFIYHPRGYRGWAHVAASAEKPPAVPAEAVWVFAGTSDGNRLAAAIAALGLPVVVSTATAWGGELASRQLPGVTILAGRLGYARRKELLQASRARVLVDATHPYAVEMSRQLAALAEEIGIPCLRHERPPSPPLHWARYCSSIAAAAELAINLGQRIFVGTGGKELAVFLNAPGARERKWFVRIPPEPAVLQQVLKLGIPQQNICCILGPLSRESNQALFQQWRIDCVVSKDAGEAGGFMAKAEAAHACGAGLIVVERSKGLHTNVFYHQDTLKAKLLEYFPAIVPRRDC